jgi:hypothetical protein
MTKWKYAVTWESETMPPKCYRGAVEAGSARTAAARAIGDSKKQGPATKGYCSLLVLLERPMENNISDDPVDEKLELSEEPAL